METALRALNDMVSDGVLVRYAIGGAVGALFYVEPVTTYDLDVFVELPTEDSRSLAPLQRVYEWARSRSLVIDREHIVIDGTPVQLLPVFNPLVEEALREAKGKRFGDTDTYVCTAEHLAAILVQTGRAKDRARLATFLEQAELDVVRLDAILARHGLLERSKRLREEMA